MNDGYDIAVVKLNKEANRSLPSMDIQRGEFRNGKLFAALGWGLSNNGKHPNSLQMTNGLVHVKHHVCKKLLGHSVNRHSICAGFSRETACEGLEWQEMTLSADLLLS